MSKRHTGLAVITGTEDRQHAYVALSRGTDVNTAYVFTTSPKRADPVPGPRPAPELARYDRRATASGSPAAPAATTPPGQALAVLAGVLDRDGQQRSATQTRSQALADADHLAILHAIWTAETAPARDQHYRDLLMGVLPPGYRREPGHQARWLWRTLRAAELAGLDPVGRRDRIIVRGRTKTEVKEKLRVRRQELAAGVRTPANYTVEQCLKDWLETLNTQAESTTTGYRIMVSHLIELIGTVKLAELKVRDVDFALGKLAKRLSTRSVRLARMILIQATRNAMVNDLVVRNVADIPLFRSCRIGMITLMNSGNGGD
jgi:hypothetical protein